LFSKSPNLNFFSLKEEYKIFVYSYLPKIVCCYLPVTWRYLLLLTAQKQQIKIRLYVIDAPEKGQDFYEVSKQYLSGLIFNENIQADDRGPDRYCRTLAIVTVSGINVNEKMLQEGYAWLYKTI